MAAFELGTAYLNVVVATEDVAPQIRRAMAPVERVASETGDRAGQALARAVTRQNPGQAVQRQLQVATQAAEKAAADVTTARRREEEAARKVAIEEAKLLELQQKGTATASQLLTAQDRLARAMATREAATQGVSRAQTQLTQASERQARALAEVREEQQRAARSADDLAQANENAAREDFSGWTGRVKQALSRVRGVFSRSSAEISDEASQMGEETGRQWSESLKNHLVFDVSGIVAQATGFVTDSISGLFERADTDSVIKASFQGTPETAAKVGAAAAQSFGQAWGDSYEQNASVATAIANTFSDATSMSGEQLGEMTRNIFAVAKARGVDAEQLITSIGVTMESGLADSSTQALDLFDAALAKMPQGVRDELGEAATEYSKYFAQMGISGASAFGTLADWSKLGQYGIDKAGDSIKEFTIRSTDLSKSTDTAYQALGLNTQEMTNAMLAGGDQAQAATQKIVSGLLAVKDPGQQAQLALSLFGTPLEDLGTDKIPTFLQALASGEQGLGDFANSASNTSFALDSPAQRIEGFKRTLQNGLQSVFDKMVPTLLEAGHGLTAFGAAFKAADGDVTSSGFPGEMEKLGFQARQVYDSLVNVGKFLWDNKQVVLGFAAAVGTAVVAFNLYTTTVRVVTAVTKAWSVATAILNGTLKLNPIGLWVTVIALVIGAIVLLYTKCEWFRNAVNAVWESVKVAAVAVWEHGLKPAWDAIASAAQWLYTSVIVPIWAGIQAAIGAVANWVLTVAWPWIKSAWDAIASAAQWLYDTIILPIWTAIKVAIAIVVAAIMVVIQGWIWFYQNVLAPVFTWLYNTIIKPIWDLILAVIKWVIDLVTAYVNAWIWVFQNVLAPVFTWLYNTIIKPIWDLILAAIKWVIDLVTSYVNAWIWLFQNVLAPAFQWLYNSVIKPVWDGIRSAIQTAWDFIKPIFETIIDWIENKVATAFENAKTGIGNAWSGIKDLAKTPAEFVVNKVVIPLTDTYDKVASKFGAPTLNLKPVQFADGGIMPGYTPGRDVHTFFSRTGGRLDLSGGEPILRPEAGKVLGSGWVHGINAAARHGGTGGVQSFLRGPHQHFAGGGIFGDAWNAAKGIGASLKSKGAEAIDWGKQALDNIGDFLSDPTASLKNLLSKLMAGLPGSGAFVEAIKKAPADIVEQLAKRLLGGDVQQSGAGADVPFSGPVPSYNGEAVGNGIGWQRMVGIIRSLIPDAVVTSTVRGGARTAQGGLVSNHALGRAVDIAGPAASMSRWFETLLQNFPNSLQLLYSPKAGRQIVWNHRRGNSSGATYQMHFNHVHWAMRNGGVLPQIRHQPADAFTQIMLGGGVDPAPFSMPAPAVPVFDTGGLMRGPGINLSGKPERVLSPRQTEVFEGAMATVSGTTPGAGTDLVTEIRALRADLAALADRPIENHVTIGARASSDIVTVGSNHARRFGG